MLHSKTAWMTGLRRALSGCRYQSVTLFVRLGLGEVGLASGLHESVTGAALHQSALCTQALAPETQQHRKTGAVFENNVHNGEKGMQKPLSSETAGLCESAPDLVMKLRHS